MVMTRFTAEWTAFSGAPGFSNFYMRDSLDNTQGLAVAGHIRTFFDAIKANLPAGLTIRVLGVARHIAEASGATIDEIGFTAPATVVGTASGQYAGPAGACITWRSGQVVNNRVLTGKTFLVPMATIFDSDGTISSTSLTLIQGAANALLASNGIGIPGHLQVWHRPVNGAGGSAADAVAAIIHDRASVLRSRRD